MNLGFLGGPLCDLRAFVVSPLVLSEGLCVKPRVFLPAILSGLLLWAAFFPLDLGPLAFVALVPWLTLVRSPVTGRRLYFAGYVGGLAFFLPALQWLRVAHPMMYLSWAGLALVCP